MYFSTNESVHQVGELEPSLMGCNLLRDSELFLDSSSSSLRHSLFKSDSNSSTSERVLTLRVRPELWSGDRKGVTLRVSSSRTASSHTADFSASSVNPRVLQTLIRSVPRSEVNQKSMEQEIADRAYYKKQQQRKKAKENKPEDEEIILAPDTVKKVLHQEAAACPKRAVTKSVRRLLQQRNARWETGDAAEDQWKYGSLVSDISPNHIANFTGFNKLLSMPRAASKPSGETLPAPRSQLLHVATPQPSAAGAVGAGGDRAPSAGGSARDELLRQGYISGFPPQQNDQKKVSQWLTHQRV